MTWFLLRTGAAGQRALSRKHDSNQPPNDFLRAADYSSIDETHKRKPRADQMHCNWPGLVLVLVITGHLSPDHNLEVNE